MTIPVSPEALAAIRLHQFHALLLDLEAAVAAMRDAIAPYPGLPAPAPPPWPWVVRWQQQPGETVRIGEDRQRLPPDDCTCPCFQENEWGWSPDETGMSEEPS